VIRSDFQPPQRVCRLYVSSGAVSPSRRCPWSGRWPQTALPMSIPVSTDHGGRGRIPNTAGFSQQGHRGFSRSLTRAQHRDGRVVYTHSALMAVIFVAVQQLHYEGLGFHASHLSCGVESALFSLAIVPVSSLFEQQKAASWVVPFHISFTSVSDNGVHETIVGLQISLWPISTSGQCRIRAHSL